VFEALEQLGHALGTRLVDVLRTHAPTWLLQMPALMSSEDRSRLRDEVFGSTPERMLRELTSALEVLSQETPIVLALEDLHWSDPSTIDLLSSIARRTAPARLMILATLRPEETTACFSLLAAKNELELHRQCKVLPLDYLSEIETGDYLATRFPEMNLPAVTVALHRRTNGNPLCLACMVDELASSGAFTADPATIRETVPDTLQFMFRRQASHLDRAEQQMLDAAAVAGESFSVAAVALALGWDEAETEALCDSLATRQVMLRRSTGTCWFGGRQSASYEFLHGLSRDSLYRRIPLGQRSRLQSAMHKAGEQMNVPETKALPYLVTPAARTYPAQLVA
jgi:predicted ATPase